MRRRSELVVSSVPSVLQRALVAAALASGALLLVPATAHAQFGKLKKLGGEIGKEVARDVAGLPPEKKDAGSSESARSSRTSADYAITAERVDIVITALAPLVELAKKEAAAKEVSAGFTKKRAAWEKCITDAGKNMTTYSPEYLEKVGELTTKTSDLLQRHVSAVQAKRHRQAAFIEDSMTVFGNVQMALMSGAKCGAPVYKPAAMIEAEVARKTGDSTGEVTESGRSQYSIPESSRKGLAYYQFGVLRERIALFALGETGTHRLNTYTAEEQAALDARSAELKALAPYFRDGMLRWSNPGDLKSW